MPREAREVLPDYYEILGVGYDATDDVLRKGSGTLCEMLLMVEAFSHFAEVRLSQAMAAWELCNMIDGLNRLYENHRIFPLSEIAAYGNVQCLGNKRGLITSLTDYFRAGAERMADRAGGERKCAAFAERLRAPLPNLKTERESSELPAVRPI